MKVNRKSVSAWDYDSMAVSRVQERIDASQSPDTNSERESSQFRPRTGAAISEVVLTTE